MKFKAMFFMLISAFVMKAHAGLEFMQLKAAVSMIKCAEDNNPIDMGRALVAEPFYFNLKDEAPIGRKGVYNALFGDLDQFRDSNPDQHVRNENTKRLCQALKGVEFVSANEKPQFVTVVISVMPFLRQGDQYYHVLQSVTLPNGRVISAEINPYRIKQGF